MNVETLKDAKEKLAAFRTGRESKRLLVSIDHQLDYLIELTEGINSDKTRLKDINIGIIAVREIEGIDDRLAELLYEINHWVHTDLLKSDV